MRKIFIIAIFMCACIIAKASVDATAKNITHIATDKSGHITSTLHTSSVTHYSEKDITLLENPKLQFFSKDSKTPWEITAKHGKSEPKKNHILLWGDVKLHRDATNHQDPITAATEKLTVYPKKKMAITHDKVTIYRPGIKIHSQGITGDLNTGKIKLLSAINMDYRGKG